MRLPIVHLCMLALAFVAFTMASSITNNRIDLVLSNGSRPFDADLNVRSDTSDTTISMVIGTGKTNIGDLVGSPLYGVIWSALNTLCPSDGEENFGCKYNGYYVPFNVRWLSNDPNRSRNKLPDAWPQDKGFGDIQLKSASWQTEPGRRLLIGSIASALQAMTEVQTNCFDLLCKTEKCRSDHRPTSAANNDRFCNIANKIQVVTATGHMNVEIFTRKNDNKGIDYPNEFGSWKCCYSREAVDAKLDVMRGEMEEVFGKREKFRDVQCAGGCQPWEQEDMLDMDKVLSDMIHMNA